MKTNYWAPKCHIPLLTHYQVHDPPPELPPPYLWIYGLTAYMVKFFLAHRRPYIRFILYLALTSHLRAGWTGKMSNNNEERFILKVSSLP